MRTPTIHPNGSSAEQLQDGYHEISDALYKALSAMADNGPDARDYYTQGDEACREASREHEARMRKVQEVRAEIVRIQTAIEEQVTARAARRRGQP
jgi:hypothetical protein